MSIKMEALGLVESQLLQLANKGIDVVGTCVKDANTTELFEHFFIREAARFRNQYRLPDSATVVFHSKQKYQLDPDDKHEDKEYKYHRKTVTLTCSVSNVIRITRTLDLVVGVKKIDPKTVTPNVELIKERIDFAVSGYFSHKTTIKHLNGECRVLEYTTGEKFDHVTGYKVFDANDYVGK